MSPVSNVSMGEGSQICTALRTGARASRIKSGTEIGGGAADKGEGGVSDVWIGVKRSMGIRLGRDRGGEEEEGGPRKIVGPPPQVKTTHCLHILFS